MIGSHFSTAQNGEGKTDLIGSALNIQTGKITGNVRTGISVAALKLLKELTPQVGLAPYNPSITLVLVSPLLKSIVLPKSELKA